MAQDDVLLDALARGEDPSRGTDPLAGVLLGLRQDVERPMPEPPQLPGEHSTGINDGVGGGANGDNVVSLEEARQKRYRTNPWVAGLVGAAAASVVVVGAGSVLYTPQDTGGTTMVELATTLDEMEAAADSGDEEAARELLEQARLIVASMNDGKESKSGGRGEPVVVTVTRKLAPTKPAQEPANPSAPADPKPETAAPNPNPNPNPQGSGTAVVPTQPTGQGQPGQGQQGPGQQGQGQQGQPGQEQGQTGQPSHPPQSQTAPSGAPQPSPSQQNLNAPAVAPAPVHQPFVAPQAGVAGSSQGIE